MQSLLDRLDPAILAAVNSWRGDHPLARLAESLLSHTREQQEKRFLDLCSEVLVAARLLERGCTLEMEQPTPTGRACDFVATHADGQFFLHVKRLETVAVRRPLSISSRLRTLESVQRPFVVSIRWRSGATERDLQQLVSRAEPFLQIAHLGDELVVRDEKSGAEIGGVLVIAPHQGERVSLMIGLPDGFTDDTPRVKRLLGRAERQFMPKGPNVIVLATSRPADRSAVGDALFGSHVERWDRHPPRGRRIAHGRADDGFWHAKRHERSRMLAWFVLDPSAEPDIELLVRTGLAPKKADVQLVTSTLAARVAPAGS